MSDSVGEQPELTAISSLVFSGRERQWNEIAHYVREGSSDPQFLFVLHRMLDPGTVFRGTRLEVKRRAGRPRKLDDSEDIHALVRLLNDECRAAEGLEKIAGEIQRNGLTDERLRRDLADMFSQQTAGPLRMCFDVVRARRGNPPRSTKLEIQNFLELHADFFEERTVDVIAAASRIFNVEEDTAKKYLQWRRGVRRRDQGWSLELERRVAHAMRDAGDPDYRPLSRR